MAINFGLVKKQQEEIKNEGGSGSDLFFYPKNLTEETNVRFCQHLPDALNGNYLIKQHIWWIGGKPYQTNSSVGLVDVIQEEIDAIMASDDEDAKAIITAKRHFDGGGSVRKVRKESRVLIPMFILDVSYKDGYVDEIKVQDGKCKVLVCDKYTLTERINALFCNPQTAMAKLEQGFLDPKEGLNTILSKVGKGKKTEYGATSWTMSTAIEDKYLETIVDVHRIVHVVMKRSDENLRSIIRNLVFGEEIVDEPKEQPLFAPKQKQQKQQKQQKATEGNSDASTEKIKKQQKQVQQKVQEAKQQAPPQTRSILDDVQASNLDDLDDLENIGDE